MTEWNSLAKSYGLNVLSQKNILWPYLTSNLAKRVTDKRVLDVGCGSGAYTAFFQENGAQTVGIDSSETQIELAKTNFPQSHFYVSRAQDYEDDEPFDILFANMVICNISKIRDLTDLFTNATKLTNDDATFLITNVAPNYQNSCSTKCLIHTYPFVYSDGSRFQVTLHCDDESSIGPFDNYHWREQFLEQRASSAGWNLIDIDIIQSNVEDKEGWPEYALYEFKKK